MKKKAFLSCILASALLMGSTALASRDITITTANSTIAQDIVVDNIYTHIKKLTRTPRAAGTKDEKAAVDYIAEKFRSYGLATEVQPFDFQGYIEPTTISFSHSIANSSGWSPETFTYGVNGDAKGPLVYAGLGTATDFRGKDFSGKIALIERGQIAFSEKIMNAQNAGAIGVVIYNNVPGSISGGTLREPIAGLTIPAISLPQDQGQFLLSNPGEAQITVKGADVVKGTSYNVVATKKATVNSTNKMVIVGAHHDTIAGSRGANDDAAGVGTVLELARVIANTPTDTDVRFITFGAEEYGILGSSHYAYNVMTKEDKKRTVGMFQMDMIGYKKDENSSLMMYTKDGKSNTVTNLGSAAGAKLANDWEDQSDHAPFADQGIPSALFIYDDYPAYHSPDDTLDKIQTTALNEASSIIGAAVEQIVNP